MMKLALGGFVKYGCDYCSKRRILNKILEDIKMVNVNIKVITNIKSFFF